MTSCSLAKAMPAVLQLLYLRQLRLRRSATPEATPGLSPSEVEAAACTNALISVVDILGAVAATTGSIRLEFVNARGKCHSLPSLFTSFIESGSRGTLAASRAARDSVTGSVSRAPGVVRRVCGLQQPNREFEVITVLVSWDPSQSVLLILPVPRPRGTNANGFNTIRDPNGHFEKSGQHLAFHWSLCT